MSGSIRRLQKQISRLNDRDLAKMITQDAAEHGEAVIALAREEAHRRGLPLDLLLAAGSEEEASEPLSRYEAAGVAVRCKHCGNATFESSEVLLNTRGMTLLQLDWLNRSATALICGNCGLVELFARPPVSVGADQT